jgi:hypothetical protein
LEIARTGDGAKINIECNGDTYHSTKAARNRDRRRNTYLTTSLPNQDFQGWLVQRFGTDERDAFAVNYYAEIDSIGIAFPSKVPIDLSAS